MDLSLIIPCHNLEDWIDPMLSSLKVQKFGDYKVEIIFVLDDCTDHTGMKLLQFEAPQYEQIICVNVVEHNCGLARNHGLDRAEGEYIWFLDGDDWIIDTNAINMILTTMKVQDEQIIRIDYEAPNFQLYGYPSMVWQYIMRKDLIGDLRFLPIQPHEDVKFMGSIMCDIKRPMYFLNLKLYHYNYMREGSNMQQFKTKGKIDP